MMPNRPFNLAIETSSPCGSVCLGRGNELLASEELRQPQRHNIDLMPAIDGLFHRHGATAEQLGEIYVSIGPGSFTGLRIAVATAKMLAAVGAGALVAVPTLDVVARNAPPCPGHLAVCLCLKGEVFYVGLLECIDGRWHSVSEPVLSTMAELLATAPRPLAILGGALPALYVGHLQTDEGIRVLPARLATPRGEAVWHLGRAAARCGRFTGSVDLLPLYVRLPEAVEVWNKRHAANKHHDTESLATQRGRSTRSSDCSSNEDVRRVSEP